MNMLDRALLFSLALVGLIFTAEIAGAACGPSVIGEDALYRRSGEAVGDGIMRDLRPLDNTYQPEVAVHCVLSWLTPVQRQDFCIGRQTGVLALGEPDAQGYCVAGPSLMCRAAVTLNDLSASIPDTMSAMAQSVGFVDLAKALAGSASHNFVRKGKAYWEYAPSLLRSPLEWLARHPVIRIYDGVDSSVKAVLFFCSADLE